MNTKIKLHILNGQVMYDHFQKTGFLKNEMMIPFHEAMCEGETVSKIFSDEFMSTRARVHQVSFEKYKEITMEPLYPLFNQTFEHIELWFDDDMFCQINILTILAWLDQTKYKHAVTLHVVDGHFKPVETFTLSAQGYYKMYTQVLQDKQMPKHIHPHTLRKGIKLYLSYLDEDSDLITFIQKHKDTPEKELVTMLLEKFRHYGLGDIQYLELIRKNKPVPSDLH